MTESILVPVMSFFEQAKQVCEEVRRWFEEQVWQPVERWVSQEERRCRELPWWNPLRWFCEIVIIVVKVVTWVVVTVVKWIVTLVCRIVVEVVALVVGFVLRVLAWLVSFFVCLFTEPGEALKSFRELYTTILDLFEDVFDLVGWLLDAVTGILDDIDDLLSSLADSLGPLGAFFLGFFRWVVHVVRDVVNIVRDIVDGIQDLLFGLLRLNLCRMLTGISDIGIGVGRVLLAITRLVFGSLAAVRDSVQLHDMEDVIMNALRQAFGRDDARIDRAVKRIGIGSRPMGLPFTADPRRFYISSRSTAVDLGALHRSGVIDLYEFAGYLSDCKRGYRRSRAEVVYGSSTITVSYADLDAFLSEGASAVPEFRVYPTSRETFERYLRLAKRKAAFIGIRLAWRSIGEIEITNVNQIPMNTSETTVDGQPRALTHEDQFTAFGRTGMGDDLSILPTLALFHYDDPELNGLAAWFRPPGIPISQYSAKTGVSWRDRIPEYGFRWVVVHEMGHYWGLDHPGHDGAQFIMFSPRESSFVTPGTVLEYALLGGEPVFTLADARATWAWITGPAAASLLP